MESSNSTRSKVAILLMAMPPSLSAPLCSELGPDELAIVIRLVGSMPSIDHGVRCRIIREFLLRCQWCTGRHQPNLEATAALPGRLVAQLLYDSGPRSCKRLEN